MQDTEATTKSDPFKDTEVLRPAPRIQLLKSRPFRGGQPALAALASEENTISKEEAECERLRREITLINQSLEDLINLESGLLKETEGREDPEKADGAWDVLKSGRECSRDVNLLGLASSDTLRQANLNISGNQDHVRFMGQPSSAKPAPLEAKLAPEVLVATNELANAARLSKRYLSLGVGAAVVVAGVAMICISLAFSRQVQGEISSLDDTSLSKVEGGYNEVDAASEVLARFHEAQNAKDQSHYVLGSSSMIPKLKAYYSKHSDAHSSIGTVSRSEILEVDGRRHFVAQGLDTMGVRFLAMVDLSGSEPKLNWEAMVGYSEMPLEEFCETKPHSFVTMRLLVRPDDYYNYTYQNAAKYACFSLSEKDQALARHGYVERHSEAYHRLRELFPNDGLDGRKLRPITAGSLSDNDTPPRRVTLRLAHDRVGSETGQIRIIDVLGEDWVFLEE